MEQIDSQILTTAEVAVVLKRTPDRIRQLAREGTLPFMRTKTGQRIFLARDVEELKARRSVA
ncbi:MAG: helix-turn-helix domain-containing protein [Nitrospira sp.]|nr:helix-turn-helix domain-containing protein [Nitrospira sp.]